MSFIAGHVYVIPCDWLNDPHDKICLCIDPVRSFFFWFNSNARPHGLGQCPVANEAHGAITKDCFLDLSGLRFMSTSELARAQHRGPVGEPLKSQIIAVLSVRISNLPDSHRLLALEVMQALP
jgi:hypothetical protein